MAIPPGNKAPDFADTTPEGKLVSLHDLAGKVVYIDVWATWCGPCRKEIPYAKKLQKEFTGNSKIAFVNI
jgi:thiol-disulfide isomerase/thioredoxin